MQTPDNVSITSSEEEKGSEPPLETPIISDSEAPDARNRSESKSELPPTIGDVQKLLTCCACNDTYEKPRILVCLHSFCSKCITTYREGDNDFIICSYCRTCQPMPRDGPDGLTPSYTIEDLLELTNRMTTQGNYCQACEKSDKPEFFCTTCNVAICMPCRNAHANLKITKSHTVLPLGTANESPLSIYAGKRQVMCKEHDEIISCRCVPCGLFLCQTDLAKYHAGHETESVAEVRQKMKRNASELERKVKQSILSSKSAETLARCRREKLYQKFQELETRIDTTVVETERSLQRAATNLKEQLRQQKAKEEERFKEVIEDAEERLQSSQHLRRMLLSVTKESNDLDALTFVSYCEQTYDDTRQRGTGDKQLESEFLFVPSHKLCEMLSAPSVGRLLEIGKYPKFANPQIVSSFDVVDNVSGMAVNKYGEIVCTSFQSRRCVMYDKLGRVIRDLSSQVVRPWDVAFTEENVFIITDCGDTIGHGSIKMFSPAGTLVKVIAANVKSPAGVTLDRSNRLYVCDEHETCVKVLTLEGTIVGQLKTWNDDYLFQGPFYVAVNVNNDVIVCDDHRSVKILSPIGELREKYEVDGRHDLQALCTDGHGQIVVVDNMKNGLHVLTATGRLRRFVSLSGLEGLEPVRSVCVASPGRVLVAGKSKLAVLDVFC